MCPAAFLFFSKPFVLSYHKNGKSTKSNISRWMIRFDSGCGPECLSGRLFRTPPSTTYFIFRLLRKCILALESDEETTCCHHFLFATLACRQSQRVLPCPSPCWNNPPRRPPESLPGRSPIRSPTQRQTTPNKSKFKGKVG